MNIDRDSSEVEGGRGITTSTGCKKCRGVVVCLRLSDVGREERDRRNEEEQAFSWSNSSIKKTTDGACVVDEKCFCYQPEP